MGRLIVQLQDIARVGRRVWAQDWLGAFLCRFMHMMLKIEVQFMISHCAKA